eukprot:4457711-Pleurochrysis_carterae.AAC.3
MSADGISDGQFAEILPPMDQSTLSMGMLIFHCFGLLWAAQERQVSCMMNAGERAGRKLRDAVGKSGEMVGGSRASGWYSERRKESHDRASSSLDLRARFSFFSPSLRDEKMRSTAWGGYGKGRQRELYDR